MIKIMFNKEKALEEEFCIQILKELQKELGGEISSRWISLSAFNWYIEMRNHDYDLQTGFIKDDNIYRIWVWKEVSKAVSFTAELSDPNCFEKVINHLKVVE